MLSFYSKANNKHLTITSIIISVGLLVSFFNPAFGLSNDTESKQSLKEVSKTKLDSYYLYFYKYCQSVNNNAIGFLITNNVESVPVLISQNIKFGECQTYGARIYADEPGLAKTKMFSKDDLSALIKKFESKKNSLEKELSSKQQKLNVYYKTNASNEKITKQLDAIEYLGKLMKSAKISIALLKST